jgi:hypothetical protein
MDGESEHTREREFKRERLSWNPGPLRQVDVYALPKVSNKPGPNIKA